MPRFPPAKTDARTTRLIDKTSQRRPIKSLRPSLDKRSKAEDVYLRRFNHDEKAKGNPIPHTGSRYSPFAELYVDKTMNWQNNTMRHVDEAKEMKNNHLTDD